MNHPRRMKGHAIIVALIGLLSAVLVALINAGAFDFKTKAKEAQASRDDPGAAPKAEPASAPSSAGDEESPHRAIFVRNACSHVALYQIRFQTAADTWRTTGWLQLAAHDETSPLEGDMPLLASAPGIVLVVRDPDAQAPADAEPDARETLMREDGNSYILTLCEV